MSVPCLNGGPPAVVFAAAAAARLIISLKERKNISKMKIPRDISLHMFGSFDFLGDQKCFIKKLTTKHPR